MSSDLAISCKKSKFHFFRVLERFLELKSLKAAFWVNKWISLDIICWIDVSSHNRSLTFVFNNKLIKSRWLMLIIDLSTIVFKSSICSRCLLVLNNCVHISHSVVYPSNKLFVVINSEPLFNDVYDMRFED